MAQEIVLTRLDNIQLQFRQEIGTLSINRDLNDKIGMDMSSILQGGYQAALVSRKSPEIEYDCQLSKNNIQLELVLKGNTHHFKADYPQKQILHNNHEATEKERENFAKVIEQMKKDIVANKAKVQMLLKEGES